jgi:hypothetical protein
MGLFRFFGSTPTEGETKHEDVLGAKVVSHDSPDAHEPPKFDAVAVLEAATVDAKQRERVHRTLELLNALPADAPTSVRKSIVEASLKAFDISIQAIVEAAGNEVSAFDAYIAHGHKQLEDLRKQSQARIAELEAEIAKIRKRLEIASADQASLDDATVQAMDKVRPILGFFGDAVAKPANDQKSSHQPSIIIDDSMMKTG